jgi:hypothetical protein
MNMNYVLVHTLSSIIYTINVRDFVGSEISLGIAWNYDYDDGGDRMI